MVKGEGKHISLSHLNRNRNKSVRHENVKLILHTNCTEHRACNEEQRKYAFLKNVPEETCKIQRAGDMAYNPVPLFFLVMAQN